MAEQVTLVLLPGMDGTATLFAPFVQALGNEFKIISVRYPTKEALDYGDLTALAHTQLPTNEPFVVLGESFSGPIAVALAAAEHPNFLGLILCCTFVRNPRPALSVLKSLINYLPTLTPPPKVLSALLLGKYSRPNLLSALFGAVKQVAPEVMKTRLKAVLNVDVTSQMSAVKVPCLYLRASHDRLVPRLADELICKLNPLTQMVKIDGPHCLLQAAAADAAKAVTTFVNSIHVPKSVM
jgi:pimeloyl-ACP methyl ester carboxylesterase